MKMLFRMKMIQTFCVYVISSFSLALSKVNITVKKEENGNFVVCVVRGNPPPEIWWEKCNITKTATTCESLKNLTAKKRISNKSHVYSSSMVLDTSREHVVNCVAKNLFWTKTGSYLYKFDNDKTEG